jgi:hypothetical protein
MRLTVFAAMLAFLMWGTPAFAGLAPDDDGDGISNALDNCSDAPNPSQDDTDGDACGNLCDADYTNTGVVSLADFGAFSTAFGTGDELECHIDPVTGCVVGLDDFGFFSTNFGVIPGPSGTTEGSTECPL